MRGEGGCSQDGVRPRRREGGASRGRKGRKESSGKTVEMDSTGAGERKARPTPSKGAGQDKERAGMEAINRSAIG